MSIKCDNCDRDHEVGDKCAEETIDVQCDSKGVVPQPKKAVETIWIDWDTEQTGFVVPTIANLIYKIGMVVVILSIIAACCFAIGAAFISSVSLRIWAVVVVFLMMVAGLLTMGFGKALEYLAEIAFNTRKIMGFSKALDCLNEISLNTRKK